MCTVIVRTRRHTHISCTYSYNNKVIGNSPETRDPTGIFCETNRVVCVYMYKYVCAVYRLKMLFCEWRVYRANAIRPRVIYIADNPFSRKQQKIQLYHA